MLIYISIFIFKNIENTLATLRIIMVSNGKKKLGAILQGIISIIWILTASIVIVDINKDLFKIIFFCLGSLTGSYLGSILEEKIALGNNLIICNINKKYIDNIKNKLFNYHINIINQDENNSTFFIICKRKHTILINNIINKIDNKCLIINIRSKLINFN